MFGISLFGGLLAWLVIFATHLRFRKHWEANHGRPLPIRVRFFPYTTLAGGFTVLAILISTWWVQGMRVTLQAGVPWLILLSVVYFTWARKQEQVVQTQIGRQESFRLPGRPIG